MFIQRGRGGGSKFGLRHTLKKILSGFEMNAVPLNSRPATICGFTIPSFYLMRAFSIYSSSSKESLGWYYSHTKTRSERVRDLFNLKTFGKGGWVL